MARNNLFIKTGSYTGNGTDNRSITGLGFNPQLVIVKGVGATQAVFKIDLAARDITCSLNATADSSDMIQELIPDGFQIGTNATVNTNGTAYYWMAFAGLSGQSYFRTFQYVGTGVDNRNITVVGINFTPDIVACKTTGAVNAVCRTSAMGADNSFLFGNSADGSNNIQSLISSGFQVGTNSGVNTSGTTYKGFAFKALPGVIAVGTYTGNGSDNRAITGVGFQPGIVITKMNVGGASAAIRPSALAGDNCIFAGTAVLASNAIQSLDSDGFTLGTDISVNQNGTTYWWIAFKEGSFSTPLVRTAI